MLGVRAHSTRSASCSAAQKRGLLLLGWASEAVLVKFYIYMKDVRHNFGQVLLDGFFHNKK